jgi:kynurenine formamidase
MNRLVASPLVLVALVACSPSQAPVLEVADVFSGAAGTWVDLSHDFSTESLYWPTADGFQLEVVADGVVEGGFYYAANNLTTSEHGGTHLDAPVHFAEGKWSTDQIPLDRLIAPAAVVDVTDGVTPDDQVTVADLEAWEQAHGPLPDGVAVLIRTGWAERWPDAASYLGTAERGAEAVADLHFPGVAPEAARWLVENRRISALGIDTPSIDYGQSTLFETHRILYTENVVGFENLAGLEAMPEAGAFIVALPMKIRGGSGGPLRIVGFVPD